MDQAQLELQLKVWKELAISKQVLMRTAAEALKLSPDCSQEELKQALDSTLKKIAVAETGVAAAQDQARQAIAAIERKVNESARAQAAAEAASLDAQTKYEKLAPQMLADRAAGAKDSQQLKDRLAEKEKALKAINTALADTPDNVLKKMKALKKEKQDEADARRRVEAALATLRKEKKEQDQKLLDTRNSATKLITQHRELHALSTTLHERLKTSAKDVKDLPEIPELDSVVIEEVETGVIKPKESEEDTRQEQRSFGRKKAG